MIFQGPLSLLTTGPEWVSQFYANERTKAKLASHDKKHKEKERELSRRRKQIGLRPVEKNPKLKRHRYLAYFIQTKTT